MADIIEPEDSPFLQAAKKYEGSVSTDWMNDALALLSQKTLRTYSIPIVTVKMIEVLAQRLDTTKSGVVQQAVQDMFNAEDKEG